MVVSPQQQVGDHGKGGGCNTYRQSGSFNVQGMLKAMDDLIDYDSYCRQHLGSYHQALQVLYLPVAVVVIGVFSFGHFLRASQDMQTARSRTTFFMSPARTVSESERTIVAI